MSPLRGLPRLKSVVETRLSFPISAAITVHVGYIQLNMNKRNTRRTGGRDSVQPMQVVSVPTMIRPAFSVARQFAITASGNVLLGPTLPTAPFRVTSIRATAVANGPGLGTVTFQLNNGIGSGTTGAQSRTFAVGSSPIEIVMRNDRHVQHNTGNPATILATFATANASVVGVIFVSFIGSI